MIKNKKTTTMRMYKNNKDKYQDKKEANKYKLTREKSINAITKHNPNKEN